MKRTKTEKSTDRISVYYVENCEKSLDINGNKKYRRNRKPVYSFLRLSDTFAIKIDTDYHVS